MNGVPQRLSVNINAECADTLRRVMQARDISVTEAIRRAIGLLDYFEQAAAPSCANCGHPLAWHDSLDDDMCAKAACYCQQPRKALPSSATARATEPEHFATQAAELVDAWETGGKGYLDLEQRIAAALAKAAKP